MRYHNADSTKAKQLTLTGLYDHPRWLGWKDTDGRKVPFNPKGGAGKPNDPQTWGTRAEAEKWAKRALRKGGKGGVGIVLGDLGDGRTLMGIDLDRCRDPETGKLAPWAARIIARFKSYTEVSPSGTGVKLFFLIDKKDVAAVYTAMKTADSRERHGISWSRGDHCEIALHLSNRYFTVTGMELGVDPAVAQLVAVNDDLRVVSRSDLLWLIREAGPAFKGKTKGRKRDDSGSGDLFRLARKIKLAGGSKEDFVAAIEDEPEAAAHVAKEGPRAIERAWDRALDPDLQFEDDDIEADIEELVGGAPLGRFGLDENGVIEAFASRYKGNLKFDHHAGKWFKFGGAHWQREETKLARHYARETSLALALQDPKSATVKALKRVSTWEAIERGACTDRHFAVTSEIWNRDKMLLGTPGGTVDLRTGELRPADPKDHISRVTAVAPIPFADFEPERDCPRWLAFLTEALAGDTEAIRFLQQWGGYSLTGETKEQVLVFVYGPGGSGKGTAINTVAEIMGDYAINVGMETLTASKHDRHTTELARLRGARMARASETEKGRAWAENRIKTLTGQDTITARFMRQDDFEFLPEFKLTIFGNNRPSLKDVDAAISRRFIVLPFDHPPARRDPELAEKLKAEWPGILSWLIAGCLDWQAHGLARPPVVEAATKEYFAEQDAFGRWLEDCCEIDSAHADTTDSLWLSWQRFANMLGEDPGSKIRTFPETLSQRGFIPIKDSRGIRGRGYKGLRVRPDDEAQNDFF